MIKIRFLIKMVTKEKVELAEVRKDMFDCIFCEEICRNAEISECCDSLACSDCADKLMATKTRNCPKCNMVDIKFFPSLVIRKIISTIISECPDCGVEMQREFLADHIKKEHSHDKKLAQLLRKLEIKDPVIQLEPKQNFKIHRHTLILEVAEEEVVQCSSKRFLKGIGNCKRKIEKGQKYYSCKGCKVDFCLNCLNKEQVIYYVNGHVCGLELVFINRGFKCNGNDIGTCCRSGNPTCWEGDKKMRYRCATCDFDLCGNCLDFYISC